MELGIPVYPAAPRWTLCFQIQVDHAAFRGGVPCGPCNGQISRFCLPVNRRDRIWLARDLVNLREVQRFVPCAAIRESDGDQGRIRIQTGPLRITEPIPAQFVGKEVTCLPDLKEHGADLHVHVILAVPARRNQLARFHHLAPGGSHHYVRNPRTVQLDPVVAKIVIRAPGHLVVQSTIDPDLAQAGQGGREQTVAFRLGPYIRLNVVDRDDRVIREIQLHLVNVVRPQHARHLPARRLRFHNVLVQIFVGGRIDQYDLDLSAGRSRIPCLPFDKRHQSNVGLPVYRARQNRFLHRLSDRCEIYCPGPSASGIQHGQFRVAGVQRRPLTAIRFPSDPYPGDPLVRTGFELNDAGVSEQITSRPRGGKVVRRGKRLIPRRDDLHMLHGSPPYGHAVLVVIVQRGPRRPVVNPSLQEHVACRFYAE